MIQDGVAQLYPLLQAHPTVGSILALRLIVIVAGIPVAVVDDDLRAAHQREVISAESLLGQLIVGMIVKSV